MPAIAPKRFVIPEMFEHTSPATVRMILQKRGFSVNTIQGTKHSEIWTKPDGPSFWIVRIDSQGHKTHFHHGARPHYHKNWVASATDLQKYLQKFLPQAMVYSDLGDLLGSAGECNTDWMAAAQHIKR